MVTGHFVESSRFKPIDKTPAGDMYVAHMRLHMSNSLLRDKVDASTTALAAANQDWQ